MSPPRAPRSEGGGGRARSASGPAPVRRFVLAEVPGADPPRLADEDEAHARRVLRLGPGDRLIGLDGRGGAWPLVVVGASGRSLELARDGEPRREPAPGTAGAALPRIELLVAWPRAGRPEAMLERLTQLGVASVAPWTTSRSAPGSRSENVSSPARARRLSRVLVEACKQCGRTWFPELAEAVVGPPDDHDDDALRIVLDPGAARGLLEVCRDGLAPPGGASIERVRLAVGPEGGLAPDELDALLKEGWLPARLGPHVLRIETAAEAAAAIVAQVASELRA